MEQMPECWSNFDAVLKAGLKRLILLGAPGIGKTYGATQYHLNGRAVYRLTCTEGMTELEVTGGYVLNESGGFDYKEGVAITAWREGAVLVLDEVDRASGDILSLLLLVADSDASSTWRNPHTGEVVRPADGFSVIITSNAESKHLLPPALADRFPVALVIDEPHPEAIAALPADVRQLARQLVSGSAGVRASLRAFHAFVQLRTALGDERAMRLVFEDNIIEAVAEAMSVANLTPIAVEEA
jgi:MoxR-like ATPase